MYGRLNNAAGASEQCQHGQSIAVSTARVQCPRLRARRLVLTLVHRTLSAGFFLAIAQHPAAVGRRRRGLMQEDGRGKHGRKLADQQTRCKRDESASKGQHVVAGFYLTEGDCESQRLSGCRSRAATAAAIARAARAFGWRSHGRRQPRRSRSTRRAARPRRESGAAALRSASSSTPNCGTTISGVAPRARARFDRGARARRASSAMPRSTVSSRPVRHEQRRERRQPPVLLRRQPDEPRPEMRPVVVQVSAEQRRHEQRDDRDGPPETRAAPSRAADTPGRCRNRARRGSRSGRPSSRRPAPARSPPTSAPRRTSPTRRRTGSSAASGSTGSSTRRTRYPAASNA